MKWPSCIYIENEVHFTDLIFKKMQSLYHATKPLTHPKFLFMIMHPSNRNESLRRGHSFCHFFPRGGPTTRIAMRDKENFHLIHHMLLKNGPCFEGSRWCLSSKLRDFKPWLECGSCAGPCLKHWVIICIVSTLSPDAIRWVRRRKITAFTGRFILS